MNRGRDPFDSFFGFPGGFGRGFPGSGAADGEEEFPFDDPRDVFDRFRFGSFGRSSPFNDLNDIFRGAETMLRHMDSVFRDMHTFGDNGGTFERIMDPRDAGDDGEPIEDPHWNRRKTPRDEMLKIPDSGSSVPQLEDSDLDSRFRSGGINVDELLTPPADNGQVQPYNPRGVRRDNSFWSGSSSVTTFSGFGDGRTEQRSSRTNPDGSKSTVVTRRIGDREYSVTTTIDQRGEKEIQEEFINMDEDDKDKFDQDWNTTRGSDFGDKKYGRLTHRPPENSHHSAPLLDPKAPSIFSRIFGSWWK